MRSRRSWRDREFGILRLAGPHTLPALPTPPNPMSRKTLAYCSGVSAGVESGVCPIGRMKPRITEVSLIQLFEHDRTDAPKPEHIRQDCVNKLRSIQTSGMFHRRSSDACLERIGPNLGSSSCF